MKINEETVWLEMGPIVRETNKAELRYVEDLEEEIWVPKSQIRVRSPKGNVEVTRWWAAKYALCEEHRKG